VHTKGYVSKKTHKKFLIHDGAVYKGDQGNRHVHSDFIVLSGGAIRCDPDKGTLGDWARIWAKKGSYVDLNCVKGRYTRLKYEEGATIIWPNGDKSSTAR